MTNQLQNEPEHFKYGFKATNAFYSTALRDAAEKGEDASREYQRLLGETDLFFLLVHICKRYDMNRKWLFDRCREVQRNPNGHLDLWAREHYKSTIITFGMTILDIINNPEITIGIFSHTKAISKDFVKQIKTEMENNKDLPRLWPEIFYEKPSSAAKKWSEDALRVKRKGNPKEETLEAHGLVDGMPTGKHFNIRIYDDVVTQEGVNTPEQIHKTTEAWQMSDNLGAHGGVERYIGTRYHLFDTYSVMMETGEIIVRKHPATVDGTEYGDPVLMTEEQLRKKRAIQGPFVFGSQMLLDPVADKSMGFSLDWIVKQDTSYESAMSSLWRFIIVDPASRKPHSTSKAKKNDYTSMFVIGYGLDGYYRILDMRRDKMSLSKRTETLFELHQKWKPGLVGYEEYGKDSDIEHIMHVQEEKLYKFTITPIGGKMKKEIRILRLVPYFENGFKSVDKGGDGIPDPRIILPTSCNQIDYEGRNRDLVQDFLEQEYNAFPVLKHDDMLDNLARIVDLEKMGLIQKPSVTPTEPRGKKVQEALRKKSALQGGGSWTSV